MQVSFTFRVQSDPRFLAVIRAASIVRLRPQVVLQRKIAGELRCRGQAVANIIRHAHHGASDREIEVTYEEWKDRLEFRFLDQGDPPNPARLQPHALDAVSLSGVGTISSAP